MLFHWFFHSFSSLSFKRHKHTYPNLPFCNSCPISMLALVLWPCLLLLLILLAHLRTGLCSFHSLYIHNFPQWPLLAKKYFSKSLSSLTPLGQHDAHSLKVTLPWLCDPAFSGFFLCLPGSPFSIPLLTLCLILPLIYWYASALHPSAFFPLYTCLFLETCPFSRLHWPLFAADLEIISPALTCYLV